MKTGKTLPENSSIRLNKAIAQAGYCSRRKADELIFSGQVKVNGQIVTDPATKVLHGCKLEAGGELLQRRQALRYIMLHKPPQVICTVSDPEGRKTVLDLLPDALRRERLYPVGRLDYFSEGLLLLTNDGDLAQRLMHPSHGQRKIYEVVVRGSVLESALQAMRKGMALDPDHGGRFSRLAPVPAVAAPLPSGDTLLTLELHQGVNRQIRRMCDQLGLVILKLKRIAEGPLELGDLPKGQCRELSAQEVGKLKGAGVASSGKRTRRQSCKVKERKS